MIAKIGISNALYGVLAYNYEKVKEGEAKILATQKLGIPLSGHLSLGACYKDFEKALPQKTRCKSPVLHISLNPHPDDKLTDEQLEYIGKEYIRELGYGNQPFVIFKHEDIEREHIHIVSLRVDTQGKKINDSFEHRRSQKITDKLEDKYGLKKKQDIERLSFEQVKKADVKNGNIKKQIAGVVLPLIKSYRFQSFGEWNALLASYNVKAEEVKGEHKGEPYTGILYSITDDTGKVAATPVKSSRFGKSVGEKALQKHFKESKSFFHTHTTSQERIKNIIKDTMQFSPSKTDFVAGLQSEHISVLFRENTQGRLYGITFIDHKEKTVFNGSRLGKDFSANVFNEYFNAGKKNPFIIEEEEPETPENDFVRMQKEPQNNSEEESLLDVLLPDETVLLDSLPVNGIDYKELAFIRKMRRLHSGKKRKQK